ncbi:MAG: hydrogenase formation protein HypD [Dethiobacteria bacterium]|jgi:hydrogenase expression/formation protein HypD|nr:hydrogenase formation protein HypD [Bacillota bacterium]HOP68648.1 hydrogenase formation protein HypD [Bacillota bacterium]HPT33996.1 hydrogenase formation protein HypD [Bacillota bacterium]HPZ64469.1 hydrogenase formation protein HypD [Bacillota bacterium]HQD06892.1 hydrogenase formation protein HypD [Bacillota bacterium]
MKEQIERIKKGIAELAAALGRITIMEVCGTHTAGIRKYGIQELLPDNVRLVSGPGCPVCVTPQRDIAVAISLADREEVIFACFGDMMRVPCGDRSLYSLYEQGREIRVITSPLDALEMARNNPRRQVIYFGIGFETTAPLTAALIEAARESGIRNLSVLSAHKTIPQAVAQLLKGDHKIDALLCPGHVASIIGAEAFSFVPRELGLPAAVAGFEAYDIMVGLLSLVRMLHRGERKCVNMYPRAVTGQGNRVALSLLDRVFEPCDALWRGLGEIKGSGLRLKEEYREFDALHRFPIPGDSGGDIGEAEGCLCARILCGKSVPTDCRQFGGACTPERPLGPCMVSSEGSCAAYYRFGGENKPWREE